MKCSDFLSLVSRVRDGVFQENWNLKTVFSSHDSEYYPLRNCLVEVLCTFHLLNPSCKEFINSVLNSFYFAFSKLTNMCIWLFLWFILFLIMCRHVLWVYATCYRDACRGQKCQISLELELEAVVSHLM